MARLRRRSKSRSTSAEAATEPIAACPGPSQAMTRVERGQRMHERQADIADADDQRAGSEDQARADAIGEQAGERSAPPPSPTCAASSPPAKSVRSHPNSARIGFISTAKVIDDAVCALIATTPTRERHPGLPGFTERPPRRGDMRAGYVRGGGKARAKRVRR